MFWVEFKDYEATVEWPVNSVCFLLQTFTPVLCTFSKDVSQALLSLRIAVCVVGVCLLSKLPHLCIINIPPGA